MPRLDPGYDSGGSTSPDIGSEGCSQASGRRPALERAVRSGFVTESFILAQDELWRRA